MTVAKNAQQLYGLYTAQHFLCRGIDGLKRRRRGRISRLFESAIVLVLDLDSVRGGNGRREFHVLILLSKPLAAREGRGHGQKGRHNSQVDALTWISNWEGIDLRL